MGVKKHPNKLGCFSFLVSVLEKLFRWELTDLGAAQTVNDIAEDVPNDGAQSGQGNDNDDRYQYEDQSIFNEALSFFLFLFGYKQHDNLLLV
jgi:hypothetical protein